MFADVIEIYDESNGVCLVFTDAISFEQYNTAQAHGEPYDTAHLERRELDLSETLALQF